MKYEDLNEDDKAILHNYINDITDFCWQLKIVNDLNPEPAYTRPLIMGRTFQDQCAAYIFLAIKQREEYMGPNEAVLLGISERKLRDKMVEAAKLVFGDQFDELYQPSQ